MNEENWKQLKRKLIEYLKCGKGSKARRQAFLDILEIMTTLDDSSMSSILDEVNNGSN